MALVIARQEGEDFYVGDTRVEVTKIVNPYLFYVRVHDDGTSSRTIMVGDSRMVQVMPRVRLCAGTNPSHDPTLVKVAIDAPQEIPILRGDTYRTKVGDYAFSRRARDNLRDLFGAAPDLRAISKMVRESAPCTHSCGNRRFENLVFRVKHAVVLSVSQY